jgi:hypothetical protein
VEQNPQRVAAMQATLEETIARGRSTPGPDQKNDARIMMIKPIPRVAQDKK